MTFVNGFLESTPVISSQINSAFTPVASRNTSIQDEVSLLQNNNFFTSKLIEVQRGQPGRLTHSQPDLSVNTPVTPGLCQSLPYSPFVISANQLSQPLNYPLVAGSHGHQATSSGLAGVAGSTPNLQNANQFFLLNPNSSLNANGTNLQQQCVFK